MLSTRENSFGSRILLLSTHRAQRRNSEPATTATPPRMIMPRYEPCWAFRSAPAAGPPHSALSHRRARQYWWELQRRRKRRIG